MQLHVLQDTDIIKSLCMLTTYDVYYMYSNCENKKLSLEMGLHSKPWLTKLQ